MDKETPDKLTHDPTEYEFQDVAASGQPLAANDSFSGEIQNPAEREQLKAQEVDYARFMVAQATQQQETIERRRPSDRNDAKFEQEMAGEQIIADPESGLEYSVRRLNQDSPGRPLVVNLGLFSSSEAGTGRDVLHEYTTRIDRPIIQIEHEAIGKSAVPDKRWLDNATLSSIGQSRLRILDQLGVDDFDVAGHSFGGVVAAGIAAEGGERVHNLVTVLTPGFEDNNKRTGLKNFRNLLRDRKQYKKDRDPEVAAREDETEPEDKGSLNRQNAHTTKRMMELMNQDQAALAISNLAPTTQWSDVVATEDKSAGWKAHLRTARERNAQIGEPAHNSKILIIGGEGHHGVKAERAMMAEMVAEAIDARSDEGE